MGLGNSSEGVLQSYSDAFHGKERSMLALSSVINMVRDICSKFNALDPSGRISWVPLSAVICVGETALAAAWLNQLGAEKSVLDYEPLRQTLAYAIRTWNLAGTVDWHSRLG